MRYPSSVRRYRYDRVTEQVVEVPREDPIYGLDFGDTSRTSVGLYMRGRGVFHLLHHMMGAMEVLLPPAPVVARTLFGNLVRYEARILDSLGVPQPTQEERDRTAALHSPGEQDTQQGIDEVLLDLARNGKRDDFMWMAQYEAHLDPEKENLQFFWEETRRRLHLPVEVEA